LLDVEIVARVERRRQWTAEQKAELMAEVAAADGRVVEVARRHQMSPSLLYNWRSALKIGAATREAAAALQFVPLGVLEEAVPATQAQARNKAAGVIEIALRDGTLIRVDALVNEPALARVLRVMRGLA
jgi:transposase